MCYVITAEMKGERFDPTTTDWKFSMEMNQNENSPKVLVYFTSKENGYGILQKEWTDGNYWHLEFDHPGLGKDAALIASKIIYEGTSSSSCRKDIFWKCLERNFLSENFNNCPTFCAPYSLPSKKVPLCKTFQEWKCIKSGIYVLIANLTSSGKCPMRPCKILEYKGNEVLNYELTSKDTFLEFWFRFQFPKTVLVYEEYLIYDIWNTIGYIGGILGMTIGFSFTNTFTILIGLLKKLWNKNNKIEVKNSQNSSTNAELQFQIENLRQIYLQDQHNLKSNFKELELKYEKLKGNEGRDQ